MSEFDVKSMPSYRFVADIQEICRPLFNKLKINYFDYARLYPDMTGFSLFTDPDYVNFFCNHEVYKNSAPSVLLPGKHLWTSYIDDGFLRETRNDFQHDHGITIVEQQVGYVEIYNFATTPENRAITHLYLNNPDFITRFISLFRDKASKIIAWSEKYHVSIPSSCHETRDELIEINNDTQQVITELSLDKNYITTTSGIREKLTKRESQCLQAMLQGKSMKSTADELSLSPRTIETYIEKLKNKTRCVSKYEIIKSISKGDIILSWDHSQRS